jgi:predicted porin
MKKSLLALAVLGAFAGAASAQSSVTLFGIVDVNVGEVKNTNAAGASTKIRREGTDGINSSRLGFRGVEDLGGGLKAGFWLEAGVNPDVGTTNSKFFNRRSTVSLLGGFGEVRLGRDYTPSFWNLTVFDPFGTNGVGSFLNVISTLGSGAGTLVRADNTVGYFLPSGIGGVYGQVQVAAGEGGNNSTQANNKYMGGRFGWAGGPVDVAAGFGQTRNDATGDKYKQFDLGGGFSFGPAKLVAQYVNNKYQARKQTVYQLGAIVTLGQGELHAAWDHADMKGGAAGSGFGDADDANQYAVGYVYNLSKRTALYGTYAQVKNKGASALNVGSQGVGSAAGGKSQGIEAGLRHSF